MLYTSQMGGAKRTGYFVSWNKPGTQHHLHRDHDGRGDESTRGRLVIISKMAPEGQGGVRLSADKTGAEGTFCLPVNIGCSLTPDGSGVTSKSTVRPSHSLSRWLSRWNVIITPKNACNYY